jgi:hypothetical protein
MLESKFLLLARDSLRMLSSRQFYKELGVPLQVFANHIGALNVSFDSKLADVGIHLRQLRVTYVNL